MLAIGGAAGAASFTHVHNVAAAHGQPGWLAWADAIVLELMSIASGLELRRRKRAHTSTVFPASVLACAVTLSLAAQVVEAEPSPIGWIAAAVPALGFLVMVKVALGYAGTTTPTNAARTADHLPDQPTHTTPQTGPAETTRSGGTAGRRSATRTTGLAEVAHQPHGRDRRRRNAGRGRSAQQSGDVAKLLPAARRVRDHLAADGQALTRAALAEALRGTGHTVSNTRVSELLKTLKSEAASPPAPQDSTPSASSAPRLPSSRQQATHATAFGGSRLPLPASHLEPMHPRHPLNGQENRES
ncbi:DUF2637 domain-containing protein [Micromonospora sp. KC207]|uniref:DUF2637 domain-containing protein n=1 Tax=Micromonospora sp. KC207 TaxID=2530377 RepID=UPI001053BB13|nr:DUF2637 domain-containing protein [Micromonospora sp. KC207]TDC66015.1 DUF2637 domain-containing protein [Micromonospora sp. KC207]